MDPSSSSSVILRPIHHVFLSFRGEDTRHNFTDHLYSALCQKNILTFRDEEGLEKGDTISLVLLERIEKSKISIIIFSKDYASSTWCLDEVAKIIECKKMGGQIVVTVFYHIDPSDIRKQTGSIKDSFDKHEERFRETPERVQRWRDALTEAAGISGWDTTQIRSEAELVGKIVQDVLKKLNDITPPKNTCEGLVGIEPRIEQIKPLLSESKVLGIWGMGGIGNTTLAKAFFYQMSTRFEGCCFIENVREELKNGLLLCLQQKIFSRILGDEKLVIDASNFIPPLVEDRLQGRKVLVVLDDVEDFTLKVLIEKLISLNDGNRIIITTRDKQVLICYEAKSIYEVVGLDDNEALLLFSKHAFKQNHPPKHLQDLPNMILAYARGHPLALEVLGSSLFTKGKDVWENVKCNLGMIGGNEIHKLLQISYDGLQDINQKNIFLDIACFFNWMNKDYAKEILEACYESTEYCLSVLIDKALVKISDDCLVMHDLLQEMGQKIILKESEPGKRSRLWDANDICRVLQYNEGTNAVKSIILDICLLNKDIHLSSKAFKKMVNLRVLKLYWGGGEYFGDDENNFEVHIPEGLKYLSNELRYLHWDGYPWETLPLEFSAEKLVELKLPYSEIRKLWEGTKDVSNLKSIDVSHSEHLTEFPRLRNASKLEIINFEGCERLRRAPSFINHFSNLKLLDMRDCESLRSISRKIHFTSPIEIDFSGCINLEEFPQISGSVKELCLSRTAIEEVRTSIASLRELLSLRLTSCSRLRSISTSICKLGSLAVLNLEDCSKLKSFPKITEEMKELGFLCLSRTAIKQLSSSIKNLTSLEYLGLGGCESLVNIPSLICSLLKIQSLQAKRTGVSQIPSSIAGPKGISTLDLSFCNLTHLPGSIGCLFSLQKLNLGGNKFESLPASIKKLSNLEELSLIDCDMLQSIPELPLGLRELKAWDCKQLKSLPKLPSNVEQLCEADFRSSIMREFDFRNCINLNKCISRRRIQEMAAALQLHCLKVDKSILAFRFLLPGDQIPKWFEIKSFGPSIAVNVPRHWCNKGLLIGFALSAVITCPHKNCLLPYVEVEHNYPCVDDAKPVPSIGCHRWKSDHMSIDFFPCGHVSPLEVQNKIVTFTFYSKKFKVKCCGLSPIYEEPNNSIESTAFEFSKMKIFCDGDCSTRKLPDVNASGSRVSGCKDEGAKLPPPKRSRRCL